MSGLDIFAWIVFIMILLCAVVIFVSLAQLPGKTARERNHPQAEAINIASWLGLLLTMGVVWVLAMIWSRTKPLGSARSDDDELSSLNPPCDSKYTKCPKGSYISTLERYVASGAGLRM